MAMEDIVMHPLVRDGDCEQCGLKKLVQPIPHVQVDDAMRERLKNGAVRVERNMMESLVHETLHMILLCRTCVNARWKEMESDYKSEGLLQ